MERPEASKKHCDMSVGDLQDAALRASEARRAAMFDAALDCIISIDHEGTVLEFNSAAENTFGHRREDVVGRELAEVIIPPAYRDAHRRGLAHYLATGEGPVIGQRQELSGLRADGKEFPVELTVTRIPIDGPPTFTAFLRDISHRKASDEMLRASEERFRLATEAGKVGIWDYDIALNTVTWSDSLYSIHGVDKASFNPTIEGFQELVHPDDREAVFMAIEHSLTDDAPYDLEFRSVKPNGQLIWLLTEARVLRTDGRPSRMIGATVDITVRKQAELALRESEERLRSQSAQLERRVEERTAELAESVKELEGFCYTVSHDFRAPLRAINSSARILEQDYKHALPSEAREMLDRQAHNANKLGQLIDDLLQFSRVGRAEINRKAFDLTELAREVVVEVKSQQRFHDTDVTVQPGLAAEGDPRLLKLALHNLIDNACKFRQPDGPHCVEVGRNGDVYFVRDTGVGFNPEFANYMFQPFHRLHTDDEFPGTGIGLANVKRVIERHGGRVWAESAGKGQGATFYFTLS